MKKILITFVLVLVVTAGAYSQEKNKEFTPSVKPWGLVFVDYYYKVSGDTTSGSTMEYAKTPRDKQGFAFRRIYLGLDYSISERFSAEFVADFGGKDLLPGTNVNSSGAGYSNNPDGKSVLYIKLANIRWKNIFSGSDLIVGQMQSPTFALLAEKVWNYRSIEKNIMDSHGNGSSFDFGAGLYGKFDKEGTFGYNVMIANGRGAQLENNKFKKYYGDLYGYFLDKKIVVDVYGDYEDKSSSLKIYTVKGLAALQIERFNLGVESFQQTVESTGNAVRPFGVSAYANGNFYNDKNIKLEINGFARYDYYDPDNNNSTSGNKESFFTIGVDFQLDKQVHIMPNLWVNGYSGKGTNPTDIKTDVVPRITVSYRTP